MNFPKYTILIVEDDQSMRDTLEAILKTEYKIIMSSNGMDAMKKLKDNAVHIAIIDILLPDIKGTEVLKMIKKKYPDIECIMVSVVQDSETIVECIKNGACDYLTKEFDYDLLRHKIKNVSRLYKKKIQIIHLERRIHVLEAEVLKLKSGKINFKNYSLTVEDIKNREIPFNPTTMIENILSEREMEILKLKAKGLRNKEIADKLFISPETVRNHIHNILHKYSLRSMSHAISFAYEKGILKISADDKTLP